MRTYLESCRDPQSGQQTPSQKHAQGRGLRTCTELLPEDVFQEITL